MKAERIELNRTYISTRGDMREITPFAKRTEGTNEYWCHIVECVDVDDEGNDINREYDDFLTAYDILH